MTDKELLQVLYRDGYHAAANRMEALLAENERLSIELQAMRNAANGFKKMVPRWVSVSERLPDRDGRYLCNVKSFAFPGNTYISILQYNKYGFREGNIYTDDVTHWMELPEPPGIEGWNE